MLNLGCLRRVLCCRLTRTRTYRYMQIFEKIIKDLPENEKEIFIKQQLGNLKETERLNSELDAAKKASDEMKTMHRENIQSTMNAIRNFFL